MRNGTNVSIAGRAIAQPTARWHVLHVVTTFIGMMWALLSSPAGAEPSTNVRYLMNEPVNAFDFGLFQLSESLDIDSLSYEGLAQKSLVNASATYDWDRNRIDVHLIVMTNQKGLSLQLAKVTCRQTLATARINAGIDQVTGKPIDGMANVADLFRPRSFIRKDEPAGMKGELLAIMELTALVYPAYEAGKKTSFEPAAVCQGALLSKDVLFRE